MLDDRNVLAIRGGVPVRTGPWTTWPVEAPGTLAVLGEVLASQRWTATAPYTGSSSFDSRFSEAFARFVGVRHCLTTPSGTMALKIALEAAGVGWGDEVVIPGLTWVADLEAVLSVGAVPVLADVHPASLCLDPKDLARTLSRRTRAVIPVHLNGAVADITAIRAVLAGKNIVLIEDAAQAHGSLLRETRVGALGDVAVFSMHNSKLLTSGEGGAITTDDQDLALRAQQLRANGRLPASTSQLGAMEYRHRGEITGTNACLSEFQAALLLQSLPHLDEWNGRARHAAQFLERSLEELGFGVQTSARDSTRTYSNLVFTLPERILQRVDVKSFCRAVEAECGVAVKPQYEPLNRSSLVKLASRPSWRWFVQDQSLHEGSRRSLPASEAAHRSSALIPHPFLRGSDADTRSIAQSFEKVTRNIDALSRGAGGV